MSARVLFVAAAVILIGAAVTAGVRVRSDDGPEPGPRDAATAAAPTPGADPCALLTADEVGALFPGSYGPGTVIDHGTARFCTFRDAETAAFVQVGVYADPATFAGAQAGGEHVEGVGDEAVLLGPVLYVRAGSDVLSVSPPQGQTDEVVDRLVELARQAVGRL